MKGQRSAVTRSISASEIARNVKYFETWSSFHGCEQVAFSDLPDALKEDVFSIFNVSGKLPYSLIDKTSKSYTRLNKLAPDLQKFLLKAYDKMPELFSIAVVADTRENLLAELGTVFLAWSQLARMKRTKERWSEADFAANVYNVLRSPAVRDSSYRTQCSIHLPQHLSHLKPTPLALRILKTRTVVPDGAIFIRSSAVEKLSHTKDSAYKCINLHASTKKACSHSAEAAFRYQATPCAQAQETPCFEFASTFWEDKKPSCELLEHAYRQNRMACTATLRHLHALCINAPVFGLVWVDGKVKAHVDWCHRDEDNLSVFSAAYPGPSALGGTADQDSASVSPSETQLESDSSDFYEWDLYKPADILAVFILVRNLDAWTVNTFRKRVEDGVNKLARSVVEDGRPYVPWRLEDSVCQAKTRALRTSSLSNVENTLPSSVTTTLLTPPRASRRKVAQGKAQSVYRD